MEAGQGLVRRLAENLARGVDAFALQLVNRLAAIAVKDQNELGARPLIGRGSIEPVGLDQGSEYGLHDLEIVWLENERHCLM
jgi:hypothetical protein